MIGPRVFLGCGVGVQQRQLQSRLQIQQVMDSARFSKQESGVPSRLGWHWHREGQGPGALIRRRGVVPHGVKPCAHGPSTVLARSSFFSNHALSARAETPALHDEVTTTQVRTARARARSADAGRLCSVWPPQRSRVCSTRCSISVCRTGGTRIFEGVYVNLIRFLFSRLILCTGGTARSRAASGASRARRAGRPSADGRAARPASRTDRRGRDRRG